MSAPKPKVRRHGAYRSWTWQCGCGASSLWLLVRHEDAIRDAIKHSHLHAAERIAEHRRVDARIRATLEDGARQSEEAAAKQYADGWERVARSNRSFAYGIRWALMVIDKDGERPW